MAKYRKKPVEVEAIQWIGNNTDEVLSFTKGKASLMHDAVMRYNSRPLEGCSMQIYTLEGATTAQLGDFIIKDAQGDFYPCKSDIFELTYDKV